MTAIIGTIDFAAHALNGLAVAPDGTLYASRIDAGLLTIDHLSASGALLRIFAVFENGPVTNGSLALDASGNLYVLSQSAPGTDFAIRRFSRDGVGALITPFYWGNDIAVVRKEPTTKEECKHGGWESFEVPRAFRNQGDCIQFVINGK